MGRRSGLGKGIDALIPTASAEGDLQEIQIDAVRPNRYQPRDGFDDASLEELALSIKSLGLLQPVLVRPVDDPDHPGGAYELIAGERRWRAAKRAGLDRIPALVREVEPQQSLEHALVENLQREDLNPVEEAAAFRQLIDDFNLSHDEVAARVGKSRSAVTNTMRLLQLPPEVLQLVAERRLGAGHARALVTLDSSEVQQKLALRASDENWSVRRVEEEVRMAATPPPTPAPEASDANTPGATERPAALLELEDLLSARLDTRVKVQLSRGRGRVIIDFADIGDLERIYRAMVDGRQAS